MESIFKLVGSISKGSRGDSSGISVGSRGSSVSSSVSKGSRGSSISSRGGSISSSGSSDGDLAHGVDGGGVGGDHSLGGVGLNGGVVDVGGLDDLAERLS